MRFSVELSVSFSCDSVAGVRRPAVRLRGRSPSASILRARRTGRALTLVEILVVIAIIAVLGGLIVPALSGASDAAGAAACVNNLRETGRFHDTWGRDHAYSSPAGEREPVCVRAEDDSGVAWTEHLMDAGAPAELFACPVQESDGPTGYGLNPLCGGVWQYAAGMLTGFVLTPEREEPPVRSMVYEPSKTVVFCDGGRVDDATVALAPEEWTEDGTASWAPYVAFSLTGPSADPLGTPPSYGYDWGADCPDSGVGAMGWDGDRRALPRHGNTVSCGFVDGHAEGVAISDLVTPEWADEDCLYDNQP